MQRNAHFTRLFAGSLTAQKQIGARGRRRRNHVRGFVRLAGSARADAVRTATHASVARIGAVIGRRIVAKHNDATATAAGGEAIAGRPACSGSTAARAAAGRGDRDVAGRCLVGGDRVGVAGAGDRGLDLIGIGLVGLRGHAGDLGEAGDDAAHLVLGGRGILEQRDQARKRGRIGGAEVAHARDQLRATGRILLQQAGGGGLEVGNDGGRQLALRRVHGGAGGRRDRRGEGRCGSHAKRDSDNAHKHTSKKSAAPIASSARAKWLCSAGIYPKRKGLSIYSKDFVNGATASNLDSFVKLGHPARGSVRGCRAALASPAGGARLRHGADLLGAEGLRQAGAEKRKEWNAVARHLQGEVQARM